MMVFGTRQNVVENTSVLVTMRADTCPAVLRSVSCTGPMYCAKVDMCHGVLH